MALLRTNLIPNPSFEVNITDNWDTYGTGTLTRTRDTVEQFWGAASFKIDAGGLASDGGLSYNLTLAAGTYAFAGYVKTGADVTNAHCIIRENTGFTTLVENHVTTANQNWQRLGGTFTLGGSQSCDVIIGLGSYGSTSIGIAFFDGLYLVQESVLTNYFDGSFLDTDLRTYDWTGTAHNSTSTETEIAEAQFVGSINTAIRRKDRMVAYG